MSASQSKTCSRCGGPLELRHLGGLEVEVCVRCGAAVLDRADLEELTAGAALAAPAPHRTRATPAPPPPSRPKRKPWDYTPPPAPARGAEAASREPSVSEPPIQPRRPTKDIGELPTGPPTPAPVGQAGGGPPPPPPVRKTLNPPEASEPIVGRHAAADLRGEPTFGEIGRLWTADEPRLDLLEPEDSTEEAPLAPTEVDQERWSEPEDDILAQWQARRRRRNVLVVVVLTGLFVAAAAAVGAFFVGSRYLARDRADVPNLTEVVGPPGGRLVAEDPAEPAPEPALEPEPVAPAPAPAPEPAAVAPAPAPEPAPAPAAPPSSRTLVERGWARVDADPESARALFGQILESDPRHHEANYGYGYALLELGQASEAAFYLCRALPSDDVTIRREVGSLLEGNGLTCE